jgi:hypothetical protein
VHAARALLLLPLLLAGPGAADVRPQLVPALGVAWFQRSVGGERRDASGAALELRLEGRTAPQVGYGVTLTWGLTDWDRAAEYIDAGNRAGSWTTDRFADVEAWVRRGKDNDTQGLRILGAMVVDFLLVASYAAVPACYIGSVGGATSHLQLDVTGSFHLGEGPRDAWIELGAGAVTLPEGLADWWNGAGPVVGAGMQLGALRVGARVLWSPPALNTASEGGTVLTGALTASLVR